MNEQRTFVNRFVVSARARAATVLAIVVLLMAGMAIAGATADSQDAVTEPATTTSTTTSGSPGTSGAAGGGGGNVNNEVVVINTVDGRFANRAGLGIAHVTGDSVENQNAAAATSSCTDCRTVAVATQIVLVQRDASNISPTNVAVALNVGCLRCETFAAAYQYVVTTDGTVRFTPSGRQQLNDLQSQIRTLAATEDVPFSELEAQIDARVEQMWAVVDTELAKVGQSANGRASKDTDQATEDTSPSPTVTPTETPSEEVSPSSLESTEPSEATSPTPSDPPSSSPSESSSPGSSGSPSPAPSESASPSP